MKIAQLCSNLHPVSLNSNQAIYSHVALLSNGLVTRGNDVDLYAAGDSQSNAKLFSVTESSTGKLELTEDVIKHYMHLLVSLCYKNAQNYDIIHSHFNLTSAFYANLVGTPSVHTLHTPINSKISPFLEYYKNNYFISFTLAQRKQMPQLNWVGNIYHGLDLDSFPYNPEPGDYLLYLGRITADKGVHLAIEAALATGIPLVIAGHSYKTDDYWHKHIQKHIDGNIIKYVGEADYLSKKDLLKNAKALLFPTQVNETFGLSMIEAMACGTPVIGIANGSVPEVIQDRYTGYVVKNVDGMVKAINAIDKISRAECRKRAEMFFSVEKMVTGYERVYLRIIEEHRAKMKR